MSPVSPTFMTSDTRVGSSLSIGSWPAGTFVSRMTISCSTLPAFVTAKTMGPPYTTVWSALIAMLSLSDTLTKAGVTSKSTCMPAM